MNDDKKTKRELVNELAELRQRIAEMGESETRRRHAEKALRQYKERFRGIAERSIDVIFELDLEGRVTYISPAVERISGCKPGELIGRSIKDCIPGSESRKAEQALTKAAKGGRFEGLQIVVLRKDGSAVWVEANASPVLRGGAVVGSQGIVRDITERKRAEEQILVHQEQLRSLASELVLAEEHERRQLAADLHDRIGQGLAVTKMKMGAVHKSLSSTKFAGPLKEVRGLIDETIRETRSLTFALSPPILYELGLEAALEWLAEQTPEQHGIRIEFKDDGRPKPLDEDVRVLLFRAARELIMNVVKHAQVQEAKVAISRDGGFVQIAVQDNGAGFVPSELDTLVRLHRAFGLFSVRERLDLLGGSFQIQSEPGQGTLAVMRAPLKHQ